MFHADLEHSKVAQRGNDQGIEKTNTPPRTSSGRQPTGPSFVIVRHHSSSLDGVIRARFASQPPPSFAFKGRLGFKTLSLCGSRSSSVLLARCG
jgi:hypothetical protein